MLIQLDKVKATEHILSVVPQVEVINGGLLEVGDYNEYDNVKGITIADITNELVMIVEPFMNKTDLENETDAKFKANSNPVRGYVFEDGDEITLTIDGITSATGTSADIGKFVIPVVGEQKMALNATKSGSLAFKVLRVDSLNGETALKLKAYK